jgi:hypothetical protein
MNGCACSKAGRRARGSLVQAEPRVRRSWRHFDGKASNYLISAATGGMFASRGSGYVSFRGSRVSDRSRRVPRPRRGSASSRGRDSREVRRPARARSRRERSRMPAARGCDSGGPGAWELTRANRARHEPCRGLCEQVLDHEDIAGIAELSNLCAALERYRGVSRHQPRRYPRA